VLSVVNVFAIDLCKEGGEFFVNFVLYFLCVLCGKVFTTGSQNKNKAPQRK